MCCAISDDCEVIRYCVKITWQSSVYLTRNDNLDLDRWINLTSMCYRFHDTPYFFPSLFFRVEKRASTIFDYYLVESFRFNSIRFSIRVRLKNKRSSYRADSDARTIVGKFYTLTNSIEISLRLKKKEKKEGEFYIFATKWQHEIATKWRVNLRSRELLLIM